MKERTKKRAQLLGWVLLVLAACLAAAGAAAFEAPDGWGRAKFGMSPEEVQKLYPTAVLEQISGEPSSASSQLPHFVDLVAEGQKVLGMTNCEVRLRFASSQLYMVSCACPAGEKSVREILEEKFGESNFAHADVIYWRGKNYGVSLRNDIIGFYDRRLDAAISRALATAVLGAQGQPAGTAP